MSSLASHAGVLGELYFLLPHKHLLNCEKHPFPLSYLRGNVVNQQ